MWVRSVQATYKSNEAHSLPLTSITRGTMAAAIASASEVEYDKWWADEQARSAFTCKTRKTYEKTLGARMLTSHLATSWPLCCTRWMASLPLSAPLSTTLFMDIFVAKKKKKSLLISAISHELIINQPWSFCLQPNFHDYLLSHLHFSLVFSENIVVAKSHNDFTTTNTPLLCQVYYTSWECVQKI